MQIRNPKHAILLALMLATALPALAIAQSPDSAASDSAAARELIEDDAAFLERLGLIRGHLWVGNALYQEGQRDMSVTHMKHPRDELYAGLVPAIEARDAAPFDEQLTALAASVETGADDTIVQAAWHAVDRAIQSIEGAVDAGVDTQLLALAGILRTAGEEYAIGVVDGEIDNIHEFQDAWGFTQVVARRLDDVEVADGDTQQAVDRARELVAELAPLWPSIAPQGPVDGRANRLHGAAARVELLAYGLQR